ncbi:hypothetical protein [Clostridium sp.]|uniref:hypothetical protein n=1 Tax=Clostridium sp. TaxID=1506 RepID=UPI003F2C63E4
MKNIPYLNDINLSLLDLMEDNIFHKIPKYKITYYINESIKIGKEEAKKYRDKDLSQILKENSVEVIVKPKRPNSKYVDLRAEINFTDKKREIILYENSIDELYNSLKNGNSNITKKKVIDIHLAHEFYHYLEFKSKNFTNEKLDKIESFKLGPFKLKSTIVKTKEIAAHAFCKELLGMRIHPKELDYIYLIKKGKLDEKKLRSKIKELENEYLI